MVLPVKLTTHTKTQETNSLPKHPDLVQRVRSLMAQSKDEQEEVTMGQRQGVTQPRCSLPCQDNSFSADKAQASSKTLRGSFDDLDIPYIDEDEESS